MVFAFAEHARDDLALLGDPQALVGTQRLNVDGPAHADKLGIAQVRVKGRDSHWRKAGNPDQSLNCAARIPLLPPMPICPRACAGASCQDRSTWQACAAARRNSARPSDNRSKVPTSADIDPESCYSGS